MSKTGMTQKQRSASTRKKLRDAAVAVLIRDGYASLTTTRVCAEAGLSQGALFKHFPSKADLIAALADHLYEGLAQTFQNSFKPGSEDYIRQGIRRLWAVFSSPAQLASYDLTVAARTDTALGEILEPIVLAHRRRIKELTDAVFAESSMDAADFYGLADFILMAVQGAVINSLACPEPDILEDRLIYIESVARRLAKEKEMP